MRFEFLTDQHLAQYGQFAGDPSPEQLVGCFGLTEADYRLIHARLEPHHRLGMAVQLGTLRFLGTFVSDVMTVPRVAVRFVAEQLGITDLRVLRTHQNHERTRHKHAGAIRHHLGYKDFDSVEALHLWRFLYAKLLVADERPIVLFDLCTRALAERKVVLPGATTLARLVVGVRERVSQRLYRDLTRRLTDEQKRALGDLLVPPEEGRKTPFDRLRTPPTRVSRPALVAALERVEAIRVVGVMENQLGALGLVVNAIALGNSRYMQAALDLVEAQGDEIKEEDVARLSPLKFAHINMLGRYHFELDPSAAGGDLRPLRDPDAGDVLGSIWEECGWPSPGTRRGCSSRPPWERMFVLKRRLKTRSCSSS